VNLFTGKSRERIEADCLQRGTAKMIDWRLVAGSGQGGIRDGKVCLCTRGEN